MAVYLRSTETLGQQSTEAEGFMDRRKFLRNSGVVGAGLLGAGQVASSLLHAETMSESNSNLI